MLPLSGKVKVKQSNYTITLYTGNVAESGTDANVFLRIYGMRRQTKMLALNKSLTNENMFQRGQTDIFSISSDSLGWFVNLLLCLLISFGYPTTVGALDQFFEHHDVIVT